MVQQRLLTLTVNKYNYIITLITLITIIAYTYMRIHVDTYDDMNVYLHITHVIHSIV